jgi:DNA gyrase subunit A
VGGATVSLGGQLLMVTEKGYAKRTPVAAMRLSNPGDLGGHGIQFATKTDALVGLIGLHSETDIVLLTTHDRLVRPPLDTIPMQGRDTSGDRILKLETDEQVSSVLVLCDRSTVDADAPNNSDG